MTSHSHAFGTAVRSLTVCAGALGVAALAASPAAAQTIVGPTSAVINDGGPGFGSIDDTRNQNGLSSNYVSGVTNFDAYLATNPTHTLTFNGFEWFSNSGTSSASVTYDLGSIMGIDRLALWNEESSGIGVLDLFSSIDGLTFTALGSYTPFDNPLADYPAQVFGFDATAARYVRFDMSRCPQANPGTFPACAIGEVAFRTASLGVPEPATWAMMIGGFGLVGGAMRRRRSTPVVRYA